MWQIESHTNLASSCIDVGMTRLHSILLTVAHRSPMLSVGSDSGQQHSNWWWCHDTGSPRLVAEHSLCTVPWSGTPCLTTSAHSRTMFLLNRAWKPGCSLGTSVHSALETFVMMRYINLHLPLPLPKNRIYSSRQWFMMIFSQITEKSALQRKRKFA